MSAFGVFYGILQAAAYGSVAGATPAARQAFGRQMEALGRQLTLVLPLPHGIDSIAGFIQWRVYGALPALFGFWALMSAAGAARGDEERGLVERCLAEGVSRTRYVAVRCLGFLLACAIAVTLTSAAIDVGAAGSGSALPVGPLLQVSLALLAVTLVIYGLTLALSQMVSSRTAAMGAAGLAVGGLYFVNGLSRSVASLEPVARLLSPFYWYDRSTPLYRGGSFDVAGTAGLLAVAIGLSVLGMWLMSVRDLGAPAIRIETRQRPSTVRPSANPLLRLPVLALVYEQRLGLLGWGLGCSALALYLGSISRQMVDLFKQASGFSAYLAAAGRGDPYTALTGFLWFGIFQALLAVFAITQVARWSGDDNEGRLETVLSAPISRTRVVLERALALVLRTAILIAATSLALALGTQTAQIQLDPASLARASLVLVPFGVSFAAIGAVLAGRVPRATVAVLTAFAFGSYLLTELGPLLRWPAWALRLSIFSLYGAPLSGGVDWTGLWIMSAVTLMGFAAGAVLMQRRDVGS